MNVDLALKVSGLTRDQLDSLMKNYAWVPEHRAGKGIARIYTAKDLFDLSVVGILTRFGMNMRQARFALQTIPPSLVDNPHEIFNGWTEAKAAKSKIYLVFQFDHAGELEGNFLLDLSKVKDAVVIDAARIATSIEAATGL